MRRIALSLIAGALAASLVAAPAAAKRPDTSGSNLVDTTIAVNSSGPYAGSFDILISLVVDLDLAGALSNKGQLTVFAPTDAAFLAILPVVAGCSNDELRDIVLFHVAHGRRDAASVLDSSKIRMLNRDFAQVGPGATIDGANIIVTNVTASNGIIHVVDQVLVPDDFAGC